MAAGGVLVAIDDLSDTAQLEAALDASDARLIFATASHLEAAGEVLRAKGVATLQLDAPNGNGAARPGWPAPRDGSSEELPSPAEGDLAMLGWTSGTTGVPRGFLLSYRNIGSNVEALCQLEIVGADDRVLLPLPLHHAYPFVVGTLTPLTIGAAIVLPEGVTGPLIMQALRGGKVTTIIGVPRLYEAMLAAIGARVAGHGGAVRAIWHLLLWLAIRVQRRTGLRPGGVVFAPVRRGVAPRLRYLVCGGARLEPGTEDQLEALGWIVLTGYGLAETSSLFTGNPPRERRRGSAGRPLADGAIRINAPDADGIGGIELRGPAITAGYLNDPAANRESFTPDGWFRTGDLGFVDRDGFLFVTGRSKEILVLGGGKKIDPEALERIYGAAPQISEIAVLEEQGALVGLVRPDPVQVRAMGATNLRHAIGVVLAEAGRELPAYQRLAGFALTDQPLPRTRLGKCRRFLLPALYRQALGEGARRAARPPGPDDQALLRDPTAGAVWALLRERYPEQAIDLDVSLGLELNLDLFGWMELAVALHQRCGVSLTEADIAAIDTIRDLLRRCLGARPQGREGQPAVPDVATEVTQFLAPTGTLLTLLGVLLYTINLVAIRVLFRLRVSWARYAAAGRRLRDHAQSSELSRSTGDRRGVAAVAPATDLLGRHGHAAVQQHVGPPVLPRGTRVPGRRASPRRGDRCRGRCVAGRPRHGVVPRGLAVAGRHDATLSAGDRRGAAARRRPRRSGVHQRNVHGLATRAAPAEARARERNVRRRRVGGYVMRGGYRRH